MAAIVVPPTLPSSSPSARAADAMASWTQGSPADPSAPPLVRAISRTRSSTAGVGKAPAELLDAFEKEGAARVHAADAQPEIAQAELAAEALRTDQGRDAGM